MIVEIKSRIESNLNLEVPVAAFFEVNNIDGLAAILLDKVILNAEGSSEYDEHADDRAVAALLGELELMSEQEVEKMLTVAGKRGKESTDA